MAIIYSYPEIPDVQGGDLLLISDTGAPNKPTRSVDIDDLAAYIGTVVGVVQNLQSVLTVGNTYVSPDGYGTFTLNDIANNDGSITFVNTYEGWGYQISAEEGINITDGSGTNLMSIQSSGLSIRNGAQIMNIGTNTLTATRNVYFPDASGTIALTSDIESYSEWAEYSGTRAGGDLLVSIGDYDDSGNGVKIIVSDEDEEITISDGANDITLDSSTINLSSSNPIAISTQGGNNALIDNNLLTTARDFSFPDADGTIALTSDIPAPGPSGSGTTNYTARWTNASTLGIGALYDNGTNVGIGTNNPVNKLHVYNGITRLDSGSASSNALGVYSNFSTTAINLFANSGSGFISVNSSGMDLGAPWNGGAKVSILNNGNFGIGTTSPARKLEVYNSSSSMVSQFRSGSGTSSFICFANTASTADQVRIGSISSNLVLSTNYTEKMRIDASGNVGIGTTNPTTNLQLGAFGTADQEFRIESSGNSYFSVLTTNGVQKIYAGGAGTQSNEIAFYTSNSGAEGEAMRITSTGNVGIGTTSPSEKLHVEGDIRLLDELIFGEYSTTTDRITNQSYALTIAHSQSINFKVGTASVFNVYGTQIRPQFNDTIDLGHSQFRWKRGFFDDNILTNGSIGIGIDYPSVPIHIEASDPRIKIVDTDGTNWESQVFTQGGALKLQARNGTNFGNISFQGDNGTTQSEYARFNSVGNFGIGTTSPSEKLEVRGNVYIEGSFPYIKLKQDASGLQEYSIINNGNFTIEKTTSASGGSFLIKDENGRTPLNVSMGLLNPDTVISGDLFVKDKDGLTTKLYVDNGSGNVGIGTDSPSEKLSVDGNILISDTDNNKYFGSLVNLILNADSDGNSGDTARNIIFQNRGSEKMRITSSGNVGIGTTSPSEKLEVSGKVKATSEILWGNNNNSPVGRLYAGSQTAVLLNTSTDGFVQISGGNATSNGGNIGLSGSTNADPNTIRFRIGGGEAMRVAANTNLGIGTTAPTTKLHVNGGIRIQGSNELYFGGTGSVPNWEIKASGTDLIINDTGTNVGSVLFNNDEGVVLPRLTTTEINAISLPNTGLTVYNTTLNTLCFYNGSSWQKVSHANM